MIKHLRAFVYTDSLSLNRGDQIALQYLHSGLSLELQNQKKAHLQKLLHLRVHQLYKLILLSFAQLAIFLDILPFAVQKEVSAQIHFLYLHNNIVSKFLLFLYLTELKMKYIELRQHLFLNLLPQFEPQIYYLRFQK